MMKINWDVHIGFWLGIAVITLIICAGCTSLKGTPVPTQQSQSATETQTVVATPIPTIPLSSKIIAVTTLQSNDTLLDRDETIVRDAAFIMLLNKSTDEITNKTDLVILEMSQSNTLLQVGYTPARLYLAAEDLGYSTENYYDLMLKTKANTPGNDAKRIAYIQFLYSAKNAAYHIADAASAESFGDYQNALAMANLATIDLQQIKVNPDLPPTTRYNRLNIYLYDYIGKMNDKVALQQSLQTNKIPQREGFSPGLPGIIRPPQ